MLQEKRANEQKDEQHFINEFLDHLIDNYKEDERLTVWMGDKLFGKAIAA